MKTTTMFNGWEFWLLLTLAILAAALPRIRWWFWTLLAGAAVVGIVFIGQPQLRTVHSYTYFIVLAGIGLVPLIRLWRLQTERRQA